MGRIRVCSAALAAAVLVAATAAQAGHQNPRSSENCQDVIARQEAKIVAGGGPKGGPREGSVATNCDHAWKQGNNP